MWESLAWLVLFYLFLRGATLLSIRYVQHIKR